MISYTKRSINIVAFIISTIIFIIINFLFQNTNQKNFNQKISNSEDSKVEISSENTKNEKEEKTQLQNSNEQIMQEWKVEIPKINLVAEISEGTDAETMNKYVGHFEDTSKLKGNIGLAAHNRGYPVNYFANIKNLKKGDEIHYKYNGNENIYIVDTIQVIKDTDWSYLGKTKDNKITLITCVEDAPVYRRCIQGTEKGGK